MKRYSISMRQVLFVTVLVSLLSCKRELGGGEMEIVTIPILANIDSVSVEAKYLKYCTEYFLISKYQPNEENELAVDNFVCNNLGEKPKLFHDYSIIFFNKTDKTNGEYLSINPKELDRYSIQHDRVLEYTWNSGDFLIKERYDNSPNPMSRTSEFICK
jgi:hypothetical protein